MSIRAWASAKDSSSRAKAKLNELPVSSTNHGVAVPFQVGDKSAYKKHHTNREINEAIAKAPLHNLPLDNLIAIHHSVRPDNVGEYIDDPMRVPLGSRDPKHGGIIDLPIVIQKDGQRFIHDGTHRATAAVLKGEKNIAVRFVDFDKVTR